MMFKRVMGKASFAKLKDRSGLIQLFLQQRRARRAATRNSRATTSVTSSARPVELFKTRTGELSIKVDSLRLLAKSLRPLPDKWHGLADQELPLPPALRRPDHERREPAGVPHAHPHRAVPATVPRHARIHGSRDADDAADPGRRGGAAVRHASQRARPRHVPAHRAGAVSQAARWSAASSASTRSTATSATRGCRPSTTPSSRCSSCTRPTRTTATSWT